ncbi:MAG: aminotransferase class V-fold PLP-dependent enzyme [Krumholzibacteria bacterium]|nr:aminotransferase class V-fold PLP-dependent enzyme [Candidatus Krumholzibacteria bacterium]
MGSSCGPTGPEPGAAAERVIYLDNAATSWPKPPEVLAAVQHYLLEVGANPGRAGHFRAAEAGRLVFRARRAVADLLGLHNPMRVVFGANATWGLNQAIAGLLRDGDHAVTTTLEHNSVLRPLHRLQEEGRITLTVVRAAGDGYLDPDEVRRAVQPGRTALVAVTAASNVCGTIQPVAEIAARCRTLGVPLLVDAAQAAGAVDLDLARDGIDLLAFAGHKGLLGPTGTGGLVLADDFDAARLRPLTVGGTGSRSDSVRQPDFLPDVLESGTLNVAGLAGLAAGIDWLHGPGGGPEAVGRHELGLRRRFIDQATARVEGFQVAGNPAGPAVGVVSFTVEGLSPSDLGQGLAREFGVLGRQGLHCAPLAHETLGTFPVGTLRFGFGPFNTAGQVDLAVAALAEICRQERP